MAALRNGSKCSCTTVYAPLFRLSRHGSLSDGGPLRAPDDKLGIYGLALNPDLILEIDSVALEGLKNPFKLCFHLFNFRHFSALKALEL